MFDPACPLRTTFVVCRRGRMLVPRHAIARKPAYVFITRRQAAIALLHLIFFSDAVQYILVQENVCAALLKGFPGLVRCRNAGVMKGVQRGAPARRRRGRGKQGMDAPEDRPEASDIPAAEVWTSIRRCPAGRYLARFAGRTCEVPRCRWAGGRTPPLVMAGAFRTGAWRWPDTGCVVAAPASAAVRDAMLEPIGDHGAICDVPGRAGSERSTVVDGAPHHAWPRLRYRSAADEYVCRPIGR